MTSILFLKQKMNPIDFSMSKGVYKEQRHSHYAHKGRTHWSPVFSSRTKLDIAFDTESAA